ncbi:hypothetical protein JCM3765_001259 [Sporobolomyces pararoseus]
MSHTVEDDAAMDPTQNPFAGAFIPPYPPDDISRIPTPGGLHPEASQRSSDGNQSKRSSDDKSRRIRAVSSASQRSTIYQHGDFTHAQAREEDHNVLVLPEFDSARSQHAKLESLSELGERTLEKWESLGGSLVLSRWNVNALCALVIHLHREKKITGLASYVLDRLALPTELYIPPSDAPAWPRSSRRPDPDYQIFPSHKLHIEWPGHQVLQTFFRLQEIGILEQIKTSSTILQRFSEKQHLYLLQLFVLDILSQTAISALQFDWSVDLWHRLDDRLAKFDPYRKAFEFFRRIHEGVAREMAEEVENWVEKEIKEHIGRQGRIDREILPRGEIASRILRVWFSLHNALEPETLWEVPVPPSQTAPISGFRRRATTFRRQTTSLIRRRSRGDESGNAYEVGSRQPEEKRNVLRRLFSRDGGRCRK